MLIPHFKPKIISYMSDKAKEKPKGKVVDLHKRVEVTATKKHPFAKEGDKLKVGVVLAEGLKKKGFIK